MAAFANSVTPPFCIKTTYFEASPVSHGYFHLTSIVWSCPYCSQEKQNVEKRVVVVELSIVIKNIYNRRSDFHVIEDG